MAPITAAPQGLREILSAVMVALPLFRYIAQKETLSFLQYSNQRWSNCLPLDALSMPAAKSHLRYAPRSLVLVTLAGRRVGMVTGRGA